jgi:hypothetical protein
MALSAHSSVISAQPYCTSQESPTERRKTEHQHTERRRIEHRRTGRRRSERQKYLSSNMTQCKKSIKTKRQ